MPEGLRIGRASPAPLPAKSSRPAASTPRPVLVNLRACGRLDLRVRSRLRTPFPSDPWAAGLSRKVLALNPQVPRRNNVAILTPLDDGLLGTRFDEERSEPRKSS